MSFFRGRTAVLGTMHGKERVIAPLLAQELGIEVVVVPDFDSDRFGTFTGEVARAGTQYEAAQRKARAALEHTGADLAIASEGSFAPDPQVPFITSNLELVLLLDTAHALEIRGHSRSSDTNMAGAYVSSAEEALDFAHKVGFPQHGIILRPSHRSMRGAHKGITDENTLRTHAERLSQRLFSKRFYIETDMRAHMNPTRMAHIADATRNLIENIRSECPLCARPGFAITSVQAGLPCANCGRPTNTPKSALRTCVTCGHTHEEPLSSQEYADPSYCDTCNP